MTSGLLLCRDPLRPRTPDAHFRRDAQAVRDLGGRLALLDHDALTAGDAARAVAGVPEGFGPAWYRGWMVRSEQYAELSRALADRGCVLLTTSAAFQAAHELPGWYDLFAHLTPRTVVVPLRYGEVPHEADLVAAVRPLGGGPAIVKDHVKSRKHEWDDACFVPDTADASRLSAVARRFLELRDEDLVGGLVVRRYERLLRPEVRVWWLDGKVLYAGPHPDEPEAAVPALPPLTEVAEAVAALACRFVTSDLAVREDDGALRVVEVGDGQVSDLPRGAGADAVIGGLVAAAAGPDGGGAG
ncbi:ATP-grasp domain-containing protein [Microbispora corallina]|uniref:ATP-grasp domain-containing protein n=1 Tax=Microbispora corallina TaxID=83302 RepID=A0ABQ4FRT7_9ACTN|nr:ATP-grasp domain-containing protein [Microbispora corallina]GIH37539.1 hypothetical protein Mco01_05390 [Microbispora corallina]